jgi:hypothetical protein
LAQFFVGSILLTGTSSSNRLELLPMWMPVAITAMIFAIGNIVFGHFEERTPKWRRVTKVFLVTGLVGLISWRFGAFWGLIPVGLMLMGFVVVHLWWLPRHGINGLTGEPRDRYYALRGWSRQL